MYGEQLVTVLLCINRSIWADTCLLTVVTSSVYVLKIHCFDHKLDKTNYNAEIFPLCSQVIARIKDICDIKLL